MTDKNLSAAAVFGDRRTIGVNRMKKGLLYIHGKGGSAREAEHYRPLFPEYDVLGFDYRAESPWEAMEEFSESFDAFLEEHSEVSLIANSIGAYFAMNALSQKPIEKAYFISPIVDLQGLILDLLSRSGHTERDLFEKGASETDFGETLSWNYLSWVRAHPVSWNVPTSILFGENDALQSFDMLSDFAALTGAELTVMKSGEHWFHTPEQMRFLDRWIEKAKTNPFPENGAKKYEKSCGGVVFRETEQGISYVLVRNYLWGFPKGHISVGETELDTARREIFEETGLNVEFLNGFRATDVHSLAREGNPDMIKKVTYFLAQYDHQTPKPIDSEISAMLEVGYAEALAAISNRRLKEILTEANDFLRSKGILGSQNDTI